MREKQKEQKPIRKVAGDGKGIKKEPLGPDEVHTMGVLGGGPSGLALAGLVNNSIVLEKESTFGGLVKSLHFEEDYTFDMGSHIIFSRDESALSFMLDLLGENKIRHERNTKILYKGRWVKYPFENGLGDLPKKEAYECVVDYINAFMDMKERGKGNLPKPTNFEEWMYYRFGKGITDKYLYPYNRKVWDYPPEKMDTFWVEGRVPQPSIEDVVRAAMGLKSEGYVHQSNFYYPKFGGYGSIVSGLADRLKDEQKVNNFEVKSVKNKDGKWIVSNGEKEYMFDNIVNTLPPDVFFRAYADTPKYVMDAVNKLRYNSMYLVMIGLNKPKLNDVHWAYIPDPNILPNRISFPTNFSPNVAPKGHSSVLAEITFRPDGEKSKLRNDVVIGRTIDDLARIRVFNKNNVVFTHFVKLPYAYIVYDLEYLKNIKIVRKFAEEVGIVPFGRFGEFDYGNLDRWIIDARKLANKFNSKKSKISL